MISVAFKEWAVICLALATKQQCVILRKGGIAEEGGTFRAEHPEFLLYPTFFHEHRTGVKPELLPLLDVAEKEKPGANTIRFSNFVRVVDVRHVTDLDVALALDPFHGWTSEVIRQRFHYRTPGLFVLTARAFRLPQVEVRDERAEYAGCKTWVELDTPVSTEDAVPVLTDEAFSERTRLLNEILKP